MCVCVCVCGVLCAKKECESPAGQTLTICPSPRVPTTQLPRWMPMSSLPRQQDSLRGHEVTRGVGWCGRSVCVWGDVGLKVLEWKKGVLHSGRSCVCVYARAAAIYYKPHIVHITAGPSANHAAVFKECLVFFFYIWNVII